MSQKSEIYNIRIQICEKCYQHYGNIGISSQSYHNNRKIDFQSSKDNKHKDFIEEEQQYTSNFQNLLQILDSLQNQLIQNSQLQNQKQQRLNSPKKNNPNAFIPYPILKIIKNQPYKYLTKIPDTKLSTKRFLNNCTKKIVQFPKRDCFQIYFQNLLIFSKISLEQWPNLNLIAKIIKKLVEYCQKEGPLMENLIEFINNYLDIKSLEKNQIQTTIPLYEYLILSSDSSANQKNNQKYQSELIEYLTSIITGNIKVLNIDMIKNPKLQVRQVLPYTLIEQKAKNKTIQSIYLKNQNKFSKQKLKSRQICTTVRKNPISSTKTKQKSRPMSSNLGYLRKQSASIGITNKNPIFSMIKLGNIEQILIDKKQNQLFSIKMNKNLSKQLHQLCSINYKGKINKKQNFASQNKFFMGTKLNVYKNQQKQNDIDDRHKLEDSIIWKKFSKNPKINRKNTELNRYSGPFCKNSIQNKNFSKTTDNYAFKLQTSSQKQDISELKCLKVSPSKMTKRASYFLNQKQQSLLKDQMKNIAVEHLNKKRMSQNINSNFKGINIKSLQSSDEKGSKSFSSSSSCSEAQKQDSFGENSGSEMKQSYKLKVIKNNLQKRKSQKSQKSKNSSLSQEIDSGSKIEGIQSNKSNQDKSIIQNSSLVLKSPGKLSVKSRRKSSFYYSNTKNNSLLQFIKSNENVNQKQEGKQRRKLKRRSSRRESKLLVQMIEEGIQVNFDQQNNNTQNIQQIKLQQNQQPAKDQFKHNSTRKYQQNSFSYIKQIDSQTEFSPLNLPLNKVQILQDQKKKSLLQAQEMRDSGFFLGKNIRDSRISNMSRISKFSFQNHFNNKQSLNVSKQKQPLDQMVSVFPQNKFAHAFIVNKFAQNQNYNMEIKKMFTTNIYEKRQTFDFEIKCEQQYREVEIISLNRKYEKQIDKRLVLFPKVFQQIEDYSTPLTQVVNRLLKFHPVGVSRLFTNSHGVSPLGQYCVWIYIREINQFKPICVNDQIPFFKPQNNLLQNKTNQNDKNPVYAPLTNQYSIWFMLLEKVLAKIYGSYHKLSQASIGELFSMITGCPTVNIKNFTINKLQKIFNEKIFHNKKAYVYSLNKNSQMDMRIDRIVGVQMKNKNKDKSLVTIETNQNSSIQINLQTLIRKYSQISLIFFNINYFFNQVSLPVLYKQEPKSSNLISFYIFNEEVQQKNDIYLCLGGFSKSSMVSKIMIYQQTDDQDNAELRQLEVTDPISYYEHKYIYHGEIKRKGNYFFETQITYGKYLCLIQADFQFDHEYFLSVYSLKSIKIDEVKHNYMDEQKKVLNPLQKAIKNNRLKRKLKQQQLETIKEDEVIVHKYPIKINAEKRQSCDSLFPYDFSNYKQQKTKIKADNSYESVKKIDSKWVIPKTFVEDQQFLNQQKQRHISNLINRIQKSQQKQQFAKLKKQLRTDQKDAVLKMMNRIEQNAKKIPRHRHFFNQRDFSHNQKSSESIENQINIHNQI